MELRGWCQDVIERGRYHGVEGMLTGCLGTG